MPGGSLDDYTDQELNEGTMNSFTSKTTTNNLPVYTQNMLLASGYDRLEAIAHLDISESGQPNDIDRILDYVRKIFS